MLELCGRPVANPQRLQVHPMVKTPAADAHEEIAITSSCKIRVSPVQNQSASEQRNKAMAEADVRIGEHREHASDNLHFPSGT